MAPGPRRHRREAASGVASELAQVLAQRRSGVFRADDPALLEQRDDLLHERANVARPDALANGEAVAADGVDRLRELVGDALRVPMYGFESMLTLRVAMSRSVGVRPDR